MSEARRDHLAVSGGELPIVALEGRAGGPALVAVPSIFGPGDDLVEQLAELAAQAGYVAVMDPFFRTAPGAIPYGEFQRALDRMSATDLEASYRDFVALLEHARDRGNGALAALGICFGGPFTFRAAAEGRLDAAITWHGSRLPGYAEDAAKSTSCAFRLHFGGADPVVPPEAITAVREAFAGHPDVEISVYPGADHGFSHRGSPSFQPAAEAGAMASTRTLLARLGER